MSFDARTHLFSNNAITRLAVALAPGDTALEVTAGDGALFPAPSTGEIFKLTVVDTLANVREVMHVTDVTGDTFTVERAQEGTTALSFSVGANTVVANLLTAGTLEYLASVGGSGGGGGGGGPITASGVIEFDGTFSPGAATGNFTVSHPGTGQYAITYDVGLFADNPSVFIQPFFGGSPVYIQPTNLSQDETGVSFTLKDNTDTPQNSGFMFLAIFGTSTGGGGGGGGSGADPTATVGPTAVNGAATTFLRSDGAPGINLTATYTWTGFHRYTAGVDVGAARDAAYSDVTLYPMSLNANQNSRYELNVLNANTGTAARAGIVVGIIGTNEGAIALRGVSSNYIGSGLSGGPATGPYGLLHTGGVVPVIIGTNDTLRMMFDGGSGAIYVNGSWGNAGDVLTSAGAGANVAWSAPGGATTGSFNITLGTGFATTPSRQTFYRKVGGVATIWINSSLAAVSNGTGFTVTGLDAAVTPANPHSVSCPAVDNSLDVNATAQVNTDGTITFILAPGGASGWTNGNVKGLSSGWTISYPLD